ncbi:YbaB/EbfC family nucleoid-associated protein [Altererythrobacter sp. MF3-039]|uniref:YbaB/EbfC family nucleoid-associated protein n=1 Tax=Altererythrobacter sp. MF3-039 TaxID=3252901 RepID=UPI00390C49EB
MKSMEEMMQAAQKAAETIQSQMGEAQAKLDAIEVEGQAGGGLVTIRCTAKGRILGVSIDDSLMKPDEKQILEDLVTAAFNDARGKADRKANDEMQKIQSGMGLPPGFNLPGMG